MADIIKHPASLKDHIHTILYGNNQEKEKFKGQFFYMADTPEFMKEKGLVGSYFSIRYGIITRHKNKDEDHNLTEQNWLDLCDRVIDPFVITKKDTTFKLYTDIQVNNRNIVVCVVVKSTENLCINAVSTAFGFRDRLITGEILYRSKKITPEQAALLDKPNAMSLPPVQR